MNGRKPYASLTGAQADRLPGIASFAFKCTEDESAVLLPDGKGIREDID